MRPVPFDETKPKLRGLTPGTYSGIYVVDANGCQTNVSGPVTLCNGGCTSNRSCPDYSCTLNGFLEGGQKRAFWLPNNLLNDPRWRWSDGAGKLTVTGERSAEITGRIISIEDPSYQLDVRLTLRARRNWSEWSALGRSWKGNRDRLDGGQQETWDFYELDASESTLTGVSPLNGTLRLTPRPADFTYGVQVGQGANDQNLAPGISAWFAYDGTLNGQRFTGEGDINVEGTCTMSDLKKYAAPIITCAPDWSVGCGTDPDNAPKPTINCADEGAYTLSYEDKQISKRPKKIQRTWTARGPGGPASCVQILTFGDEEAPVFTKVPAEAQVSCGEVIQEEEVEATDNCGTVTITLNESRSDEKCAGSYDLQRVWTATDENGNTSTYEVVVHVIDETAPTFAAAPPHVVIECGEAVPTDSPSIVDDCGGIVQHGVQHD